MALRIVFIGMLPPDSSNPEERRFVEELRRHAREIAYVRGIGIKGFGSRQLRSWPGRRGGAGPSVRRLLLAPPRQPMRGINLVWIRRQLNAITGCRPQDWVLWARFPSPELVDATQSMDFYQTVYEPIDRYEESLDFTPSERRRISSAQARLLARARVITGGRGLATRLAHAAGGTSWLPFGLDQTAWATSPPARRRTGRPTIGVVAEFDWRVDELLIEQLARQRPGWEIELVGPTCNGWGARLRPLPNIRFMGRLDPASIPARLDSFDVGLIPYVTNGWTRACLPVKVFEYLAAGLPVVSTELPELDLLSDVVTRVPAGDVVSTIEVVLGDDTPRKRRQRIDASRRFTLQERASQAVALLSSPSLTVASR